MSSYSETWFEDSIKWYVTDEILDAELPLFTEVYAVFASEEEVEYNSFEDLQRQPFVTNRQRAIAYSVERPSIDTLVFSCRFTPGSPTINSLALITVKDGSEYLIAKITRGTRTSVIIPSGIDRIFKFKLPYRTLGDIKIYPNIKLMLKRYSNSPVGEEFVAVGEHHHNVDWGGVGSRDAIPVLPSSGRYVLSSDYNIQDGFEGTSYVYNESGSKTISSGVASLTGKIVTNSADADIVATSSIDKRAITNTITDILANVMEEYLMATNSIQILGHAIPTESSIDASSTQYVLYTDKVGAVNDRQLKAISSADFRSWLVKRVHQGTNATITSDSCVTIVEAVRNITSFTLGKTSQVAFIINRNDLSFTSSSIEVTVDEGPALTLYPGELLVVSKDSSGNYGKVKVGSINLVKGILNGTIGFSRISFSDTPGSNTVSTNDYISVTSGSGITSKATVKVSALDISGQISANKFVATDGFYLSS